MRSVDIDIPYGLIAFVMLALNGVVYLTSILFEVAPPLGEFLHTRLEVVLGGFLIGILVGKWMEGGRWRANAKEDYIRLFSRGRVYKVSYDSLVGSTHYKDLKKKIAEGDYPEWWPGDSEHDTNRKLRTHHWPANDIDWEKEIRDNLRDTRKEASDGSKENQKKS